jgi:nucleoside 2-deoxyribosyltransferase
MPSIAEQLESAGHRITLKWWLYENVEAEGSEKAAFLRQCALDDMQGVFDADVLVLINSAKSEGKAFEQGLAVAEGIPIIAVGELGAVSKNTFHYLDSYTWVPTVQDAVTKLETIFN